MIKHLILVNGKSIVKDMTALSATENGIFLNTIPHGNKNYAEIFFKHNGTVNKFSFPKEIADWLAYTYSDLTGLISSTDRRTHAVLTPNSTFYLPNYTTEHGIISNTTVDTGGKIVPGVYGFMLVKRNVPFNKRNKWYVEIIVKEETTYADFANILDARFKEIDSTLSVTLTKSGFVVTTSNWKAPSYDIMFDGLAKYAFYKDAAKNGNYRNHDVHHMFRKLTTECDADYGFDYTETAGENLYKGRNPEALYNELIDLGVNENNLSILSIKVSEPSLFRTLDPRINQSYTFIGNNTAIGNLAETFFGITPANTLPSHNNGDDDGQQIADDPAETAG